MAPLLDSYGFASETEVSGALKRGRNAHGPGQGDRQSASLASFQDADDTANETLRLSSPPDGSLCVAQDVEGCDIHVCGDLDAASGHWSVFQQTAELTPFQRYEWLRHWYDCHADEQVSPRIVFVYAAGALRMIVPFAVETGHLVKRLVWLGHRANDHNAPLVDADWLARLEPQAANRLWHRITRVVSDADYIHLIRHPSHLGTQRNPFIGDAPKNYSSASHFLTLSRNWPAFYERLRGTKSRRRLREKARRLAKVGRVRFRRVRDRQEVADTIELLLVWKKAQLERRGARNPFEGGRLKGQLLAVASDPAADDVMRVYVLEVGDRCVAATVVLTHGGIFNFFVPAYDDRGIHNCSPGTIMLVKLIELAARAGCTKFDFSLGDEAYKAEWCDTRMAMTHQTEALSAAGVALAASLRVSLDIKRRIKSSDWLLGALQFANSHRMALMRRLEAGAESRS